MLKYGRRSKIKSAMESWKGDLSIYAKNDYYTHINWLVQICRRQFYDICKNFTPGANSTGALKSLTTFFTFAGSVNMSSIYTDFDFLPLPMTPWQQKKSVLWCPLSFRASSVPSIHFLTMNLLFRHIIYSAMFKK